METKKYKSKCLKNFFIINQQKNYKALIESFQKNYELILVAEKSSILIELILDRMSKFGINYKINKNIQRSGKIPDVDIETVEKSIFDLEQQIEQTPYLPNIEYLMELYSKVIMYLFFILKKYKLGS